MNIGYNHAIRLIDLLEERGVKHVVGATALALNRQLRPSRPCFARRLKRFAAFSRKNGRRMACKAVPAACPGSFVVALVEVSEVRPPALRLSR